jgi:hypothetical protein
MGAGIDDICAVPGLGAPVIRPAPPLVHVVRVAQRPRLEPAAAMAP